MLFYSVNKPPVGMACLRFLLLVQFLMLLLQIVLLTAWGDLNVRHITNTLNKSLSFIIFKHI